MRLLPALFALFVAVPAWADCPLDLGHGTGIVIFSDRYMLAFRPDPLRVEVGLPFTLLMNVCTKGGDPAELVAVDAATPDRHMNGAATIKGTGDGRFRVDGLLFHAPGSWEVAFDVRPADKPDGEVQRLTHDFVLK